MAYEKVKLAFHIVFVEDVPAEAAAVEYALRKSGMLVDLRRVETREAFLRELESKPDVILSDHGLPEFDGFQALAIAREKLPSAPFIFVTNALTPEMEIEKLAPGVTEFVSKRNLEGLAPAIHRATRQMELLWTGRDRQDELARIAEKVRALLMEYEAKGGMLPVCSCCKKVRDNKEAWHPMDAFFEKRLNLKFTHSLCPDCVRDLLSEP